MKDPAFIEKMKTGPVALLTVMKPGPPTMTANLIQWFGLTVVVSLFAGYVTSRALGPGASYLEVFRFAGTVAFAGYSLGQWQDSIRRAWSTTDQEHDRRSRVRAALGRHVRLALAGVGPKHRRPRGRSRLD